MGRFVSARRRSDVKPYADDPLYQYLTRVREQAYLEGQERTAAPAVATDPSYRDKERARRYGLSLDDYHAILARQGNACAICRKPNARLCIDHCHASGTVRGLLCSKCNTGLGCYNDDPGLMEAATAYFKAAHGKENLPCCRPRESGDPSCQL
jgi:hypothetical protein